MKRYASGLALILSVALPAAALANVASPAGEKPSVVGEVKNGAIGSVAETMTAGDYTYVRLQKEKESAWVACPVMQVKVGDRLAFRGCTPMMNFESKGLNRTFGFILFCGAPLSPATAAILSKESTGSSVQVPTFDGKSALDKAKGKNAHTVADCFAKSAELNKQKVTVKGKVMKVNTGILGRVWVHLQDGTGSQYQKNNDLMVTTSELPRVGEVVTFAGILVKDRDFGSGYSYKVIVEDATLVR